MLLLSALLGPVEERTRRAMAPAIDDVVGLQELFPESADGLNTAIPRFEPDLMGQEVVLIAMSAMREDEREAVARSLIECGRERYLGQATLLWSRDEAAGWVEALYLGTGKREAAQRGKVLEALYRAVMGSRKLEPMAQKLRRARRSAFVKVAQSHLDGTSGDPADPAKRSEHSDGWEAFLKAMLLVEQPNLFLWYLEKALRDVRLSRGDMPVLMSVMGVLDSDDALSEGTVWPKERDEQARRRDEIVAGLAAQRDLQRLHACIRLASAGWSHRGPLSEEQYPGAAVPRLLRLARSKYPTDRIGAYTALYALLGDGTNCHGPERAGRATCDGVLALFARIEPEGYAEDLKLGLLRQAFSQPFQIETASLLLPREPAGKPSEPPPLEIPDELKRLLTGQMGQMADHAAEELALVLFATGSRAPSVLALVPEALDWGNPSASGYLRSMVRLAAVPCEHRARTAVDMIERAPPKFKAPLVAVAAHHGALDIIDALLDGFVDIDPKIDLLELREEIVAAHGGDGGGWSGRQAGLLRDMIGDFIIGDQGHLIHKLKAKDTTERWAYYFVLVKVEREQEFLEAIKGPGTIDLEDYGKIVASCYGERPSEEIRDFLKERYDFDV